MCNIAKGYANLPPVLKSCLFFSAADNVVTLTEFEASPSGMISSFTARFPGNNSVLEELWRKEMPHHKL